MAEQARASLFAVIEESTTGTPVWPTSGAQFLPIRPGTALTGAVETIESDENSGSIGVSKGLVGLETPSGTHSVYIKHSETEGQAPEVAPMIKSIFGSQTDNGTEYVTVAGSTTKIIKVADGTNFSVGQALLIKDGTNGYEIRMIESISTNDLTLNFDLDNAPTSGVSLGKAIFFDPSNTGHPSFTAFRYHADGAAIEAQAGCLSNAMTVTANAGAALEGEFGFAGTKMFYNPVEITATNKYIDFNDGGVKAATLTEKTYKTVIDLAAEIQSKMDAQSSDTITCTYNSITGIFNITSDGSTLSLLWQSGTNTANTAGGTIGFSVVADDTGALTYDADAAMDYSTALTPSYDDATNIVVKNNELFIGDETENFCREADNIVLTVNLETEDEKTICAESGLKSKVPVNRTCNLAATLTLKKYEVELFNKFINNTRVKIHCNLGAKDSAGNWIAGKCFVASLGNATINSHTVSGDNIIVVEFAATGYVTSSLKDIYVNYV